MLTAERHWKTEIADLRDRANAVRVADFSGGRMSARAAARTLSGVVRLVATRWSVDTMQRACAELARSEAAWRTGLGSLPGGDLGVAVELIAVIARGILTVAGTENLRAALSFWATEDDPAVWSDVAAK